jgi:hypothetical protein
MLYSELLKTDYLRKAFEKAKVDDIESPLLDEGDFPSGFPADVFTNAKNKYLLQTIDNIVDQEIIARCRKAQVKQIHAEHESKMKAFNERKSKVDYIKPIAERYIKSNLKPEFKNVEEAMVNLIAEETVDNNHFQVHPERGFESGLHQYDDSISELQNLLKQASVICLNENDSPEEIVLKTIHKNGYSKLLKP